MPPPTYTIVKNEIVVLCDTQEAKACADLAMLRDKSGRQDSDWWGHPWMTGLPDGSTMLRVPVNARNIALLHECGAVPNRDHQATERRLEKFRFRPPRVWDNGELPFKPFQHDGVNWLLSRNLSGILAYEPGLGKTLTAIGAMRTDQERFFPCVVMAPAHVKLNWGDPETGEWAKWGGDPDEAVVLFGRTPDPAALRGKKLIVLNHHILAGWADALIQAAPETLLIDEAHDFVNSASKTYPLVERLAVACGGRVLLLTATPLVNDLGDLWSLCHLCSPDLLGLKMVFADTFMPEERAKARLFASRWRGSFDKSGWAAVARARLPKALRERRMSELAEMLHKTVILRVRRADVVEQLPAVTETHLRLDLPETTAEGVRFWETERECAFQIEEGKEDILASDKAMAAYGRAKRNAVMAKIPHAKEWLEDFLSESSEGEKIVVCAWAREPLLQLHSAFKGNSLLINGDVESRKKHELAKRFAADPKIRILFGNMDSIGTGIDQLVAANSMLFIELPMTDVDLEQVKGRIDRLSQTSKALFYYFMTIRGTIEEKRGWGIIRRKQKLTEKMGLGKKRERGGEDGTPVQ